MPRMTSSELAAFEARRNRHRHTTGEGVPAGRENELHEAIQAECARRGWIALHGAMSRRTYRTLGEPDFIILGDRGRCWHIECKTSTGKLSVDQQAMAAHYRKLGHAYHVVRSLRDFNTLISASAYSAPSVVDPI